MGSGQNDMSLPDHFRYGLKAPVPKVRSYVTGFSAQNQQYATAALGTTIRIDLPQINNTFLDPNFSFLRFDLTSTVAAELDSSAASWINRVEVYGAGQSQLLESISSYNVLHQALLDVTASPTDTEYAWSVFGGTQEANPRRGLALGAGTTYTFSIPLISILGLSTTKALPMVGYTILISCENPAIALISASATTYTVSNVSYVATLHELPPEINQALMASTGEGGLIIPATSWRSYSAPLTTALTSSVNIGVRVSSLKTLLCMMRASSNFGVTTARTVSDRIVNNLYSYQFRIGSEYIPTRPVTSIANIFAELMKSLHTWGNPVPTSIGLTSYSQAAAGSNGAFLIGQDLESISRNKTDVMMAGKSTINNISCWCDLVYSSAPVASQFDAFAHYDLALTIQGITVTAQF